MEKGYLSEQEKRQIRGSTTLDHLVNWWEWGRAKTSEFILLNFKNCKKCFLLLKCRI